jgi:hydroxymethylbilane synthase
VTAYAPTGAIRLGARRSPLARAQADQVAAMLAANGVESVFVGITTRGDVDHRQLTEIGGTGVFATAVRDALHRGEIDVAVHSLKDLPTAPDPDVRIVAVPVREDTRDVLVGSRLRDLPPGARIGTGSPRRAVQLQDWAERSGKDLEIVPVRGNVDTRIELVRSGTVHAVVLAAAGLRRLGHISREGGLDRDGVRAAAGGGPSLALVKLGSADIVVSNLQAEVLDYEVMLPAPGQGALALEVHRSLSPARRRLVEALDDATAHAECLVERSFLATLEAGCTAPVGARALVKSVRGTSLDLTLTAVIGRTLLSNLSEPTKAGPAKPSDVLLRWEAHGSADDPAVFGSLQAGQVLAKL